MISGLSDLLRHALESAEKQEVTLKEELKFIELYLDIQKVRFSDRLTVQLEIAPDTLNAVVPNLILQPLVENAIRHGISLKNSSGLLRVKSWREDNELHLVVSDDGPGLPSGWQIENNEGIGLANTNERLKHLYGNKYRFDLRNGTQAGTTASITIPFQISADRNLK
jgi:LytS/YehU family sensor histidine kinase